MNYCRYCYRTDGAHLERCDSPELEPMWLNVASMSALIIIPAVLVLIIGAGLFHVWGF